MKEFAKVLSCIRVINSVTLLDLFGGQQVTESKLMTRGHQSDFLSWLDSVGRVKGKLALPSAARVQVSMIKVLNPEISLHRHRAEIQPMAVRPDHTVPDMCCQI